MKEKSEGRIKDDRLIEEASVSGTCKEPRARESELLGEILLVQRRELGHLDPNKMNE